MHSRPRGRRVVIGAIRGTERVVRKVSTHSTSQRKKTRSLIVRKAVLFAWKDSIVVSIFARRKIVHAKQLSCPIATGWRGVHASLSEPLFVFLLTTQLSREHQSNR